MARRAVDVGPRRLRWHRLHPGTYREDLEAGHRPLHQVSERTGSEGKHWMSGETPPSTGSQEKHWKSGKYQKSGKHLLSAETLKVRESIGSEGSI